MILIDYSSLFISTVLGKSKYVDYDINMTLVRNNVLGVIGDINKKFKNKYGELIICLDGENNWRKVIYPHYKFKRKDNKKKSKIDWDVLLNCMNQLAEEMKNNLPFKVLKVKNAEADDIIAHLALNTGETSLIVSSDGDFLQLQKHSHIDQYCPIQKKYLEEHFPEEKLKRHVIKGDSSDCIPNILSPLNCLFDGIRQKQVRNAKLNDWIKYDLDDLPNFFEEIDPDRLNINRKLVDLEKIPQFIKDRIDDNFHNYEKHSTNVLKYFMENNLKDLTKNLGDFTV